MPSFDIVSDVDKQEVDNALNQARKEIVARFDLKDAKTEIIHEKERIVLTADDAAHLKSLREIVIGKLSKRGVDLRNIEQIEPEISSVGHARQELKITQGLEGTKANRGAIGARVKVVAQTAAGPRAIYRTVGPGAH